MLDRISTQVLPNGAIRYAEFDAAGNFVQHRWILRADEPSEPGTKINKATLLDDTTANFLGLTGNRALPTVALMVAATAGSWNELPPLLTPGTGNWIAPNPFGDGQPYELGALIIGAGGAGGLAIAVAGSIQVARAVGGASGETAIVIMTVTPGQVIPRVVGAGGVAETRTTVGVAGVNGAPGATSSFGGTVALGGNGGRHQASNLAFPAQNLPGADGGQGSDAVPPETPSPNAPAFGRITIRSSMPSQLGQPSSPAGRTTPIMCVNPFTPKRILAAGGFSTADAVQLSAVDGAVGGTGGTTAGTYAAPVATAPGCGGGAIAITALSGSVTATSGRGAPGAIFLYARRRLG